MDSSATTDPGTDSPGKTKTQYGLSMVYAPNIDVRTFLYFWRNNKSCSLRDYSHSDTTKPKPCRDYRISEVERAIVKVFPFPLRERPNLHDVAYWHQKTLELNAEYSDKYPELLQK